MRGAASAAVASPSGGRQPRPGSGDALHPIVLD